MTISDAIPPSYTTRWKASTHSAASQRGIAQSDSSGSSRSLSSPARKLNNACDRCRASRVKCTGGVPCERCASSSKASSCSYSLSRRRGKHKARDSPSRVLMNNTPPQPIYVMENPSNPDISPDEGYSPDHGSLGEQFSHSDNNALDTSLITAHDSMDSIFNQAQSPSLSEFLNILEPYDRPPPTVAADRGTCSESCYLPVYSTTNKLTSFTTGSRQISLDKLLTFLDEATLHAKKYLTCPNCDPGCPRLVNLAMLHQRQVDRLCDIVKQPAAYLDVNAPRMCLGEYQASRSDDIMLKRMILLRVARDACSYMNEFQIRARDFEERYIEGTLSLGEAGRLTLTWLLDIAANLTKRLRCVQFTLEKEDWASHLHQEEPVS